MKTFKEFISERDTNEEDKWYLVDALNQIKDDCQQFLHKVARSGKFHPIYYSLSSSPWPKTELKSNRTNPAPSNDAEIRESIDRVFTDQYGRDFRKNALYVSGDPKDATGNKHLIFPIGKFDYLWSEKLADLENGLGPSEDEGDLYYDMHQADTDAKRDRLVKSFLKENEFKYNEGLMECVDKKHELMLECKYFYAIPTEKVLAHYETFKKLIGDLHVKQSLKADLS